MPVTLDHPSQKSAPTTPTNPQPKKRQYRDDLPLGVRRAGLADQARPWLGGGRGGNVNLGLWHPDDYEGDHDDAIAAAARAAREFLSRMSRTPTPDIWDTIREMQKLTWRARRDPDTGRVRWVAEPVRRETDAPIVPAYVLPPNVVATDDHRFALVRRKPVRQVLGVFDAPEAAWAARRAAGFGPTHDRGSRSVTGGPGDPPAVVTGRRSSPVDVTTERQRIAAYLAEHGPTPGERLAAALGHCADAFWPLINYRWFDVVTGGWGLTARGRAEGLGGAGG
jgi:hypothetical protein